MTKNHNNYRDDFQIFNSFEKEYKKPLVYLDSAASSLTPDCVVLKMSEYYTQYRSNIDRSDFFLSQKATKEYENVRNIVAEFISAGREEVFFTSGATDAANKVVDMWIELLDIQKGDKVAMSVLEHHAVYVTVLEKFKKLGVDILDIELETDLSINIKSYTKALDQKPKIVFISHANNISGSVNNLPVLSAMAHSAGSYIISDGSQVAGHIEIKVKELGVDAYFWSAHKMCGPTGVGVVYIKKELIDTMLPSVYGGGIVTRVENTTVIYNQGIKRFEAGTPNIAGVIGFGTAIEYVKKIGLDNIKYISDNLLEYTKKELNNIKEITVHCASKESSTGIISFAHSQIHSHDITYLLGVEGIALRSGYHCSEPLVRTLSKVPLTRLSVYLYNTPEDIDIFITGLKKVIQRLI